MDSTCMKCERRVSTSIFDLCGHESATYQDNFARPQQHTVSHMRKRECGAAAIHFVTTVPNG